MIKQVKIPQIMHINWPTCDLDCLASYLFNIKKDYEMIFCKFLRFNYKWIKSSEEKRKKIIEFNDVTELTNENLVNCFGIQRNFVTDINKVFDVLDKYGMCIVCVNPYFYKFDQFYLDKGAVNNNNLDKNDIHSFLIYGYDNDFLCIDPYYSLDFKFNINELSKCYYSHYELINEKIVDEKEFVNYVITDIDDIIQNQIPKITVNMTKDIINHYDYVDKELLKELNTIFYSFGFRQEMYCILIKYIMSKCKIDINIESDVLCNLYSILKKFLQLGTIFNSFSKCTTKLSKEECFDISKYIVSVFELESSTLEKIKNYIS